MSSGEHFPWYRIFNASHLERHAKSPWGRISLPCDPINPCGSVSGVYKCRTATSGGLCRLGSRVPGGMLLRASTGLLIVQYQNRGTCNPGEFCRPLLVIRSDLASAL